MLNTWYSYSTWILITINTPVGPVMVSLLEKPHWQRNDKNNYYFSILYSRLGQIFRMEKQVVIVAKYIEDPKVIIFNLFKLNSFAKTLLQQAFCIKSSSYPLLPGLVRPNKEKNSVKSKKRLHF